MILLSAILRETDLAFCQKQQRDDHCGCSGHSLLANCCPVGSSCISYFSGDGICHCCQSPGSIQFSDYISEILPNGFGPIIVESTLGIGYAIMEESGLSFLGVWHYAAHTQLGKSVE